MESDNFTRHYIIRYLSLSYPSLLSSSDPTYERGSGDIRLIPQALLMLTGEKFLSANHIAEKTIYSATLEILSYFSTMT